VTWAYAQDNNLGQSGWGAATATSTTIVYIGSTDRASRSVYGGTKV